MVFLSDMYRLTLIFLVVPACALGDRPCNHPYECMTSSQCAERLIGDTSDDLIFRCENRNKICCPPNKSNGSIPKVTSESTINIPPTCLNSSIEKKPNSSRRNCSICDTTTTKFDSTKNGSLQSRFADHRNFRLLPSTCGITPLPNRIAEGEEADLAEFPWMALLGVRDRNESLKWQCGGTLISERYVLTAAHCIYREQDTVHVVRLGEHNLDNAQDCDKISNFCLNPPQDLIPEEIVVHEEWNRTTIKNDIALVRLPSEVRESLSISPICLPLDANKIHVDGNKFDVAGWGKTEWFAELGSNVLRKATISGVSKESCNICKGKIKESYCPITDKQICVQGWKSVDLCKGDSGGPLMMSQQKIYQVGITSFKSSDFCGADNIPSIFTRVESYLDWILDNMRD